MLTQLDTLIGFVVVMSIVSMLVTILTQVFSSLMGLRGSNLADALVTLFHRIDKSIPKAEAAALADHILTRAHLSDFAQSVNSTKWKLRWKRASAIRADELLDTLRDLNKTVGAASAAPLVSLKATSDKLLAVLGASCPSATTVHAAMTAEAMQNLITARGADAIDEVRAASDVALQRLTAWFNSALDRAQEWYAAHTRWITIVASIIAAFTLQLDTFEVFKHLSTNSEFRDHLVASADAIQKQFQEVVSPQTLGKIHADIFPDFAKEHGIALTDALRTPPEFQTLTETDAWLRTHLSGTENIEKIIEEYNDAVQDKIRHNVARLTEHFGNAAKDLDATSLSLWPTPYPSSFWKWLCVLWNHLPGVLASAALLSLGAPYWFNLLKDVTNLRSSLASQIEKNPTQKPASPPPA